MRWCYGMTSEIVVEAAWPHRIVVAAASFLRVFGMEEQELVGHSLQMLYGPCTDGKRITRLIERAPLAGTSAAPACMLASLYGWDGAPRLVAMDAVQSHTAKTRVLRVRKADAICTAEALSDDGQCRMVLSAATRRIERVSGAFATRYGCEPAQARGQVPSDILGPRFATKRLRSLLDSALGGTAQHREMLAFTGCTPLPSNVTVTPVHDGMGSVTQFQLVFSPDRRSIKPSLRPWGGSARHRSSFAGPKGVQTTAMATMLLLTMPGLFSIDGPSCAASAPHAVPPAHSPSSQLLQMRQVTGGLFQTEQAMSQYKGNAVEKALRHRMPVRAEASPGAEPRTFPALRPQSSFHHSRSDGHLWTPKAMTLMLDLDKTALYGNDGNDLGIALQWMDKDQATVETLYRKLVNPSLRKMHSEYIRQGKDVEVVIYTRRPQILYYRSCVRHNTVPMRYADDMADHEGQLHVPPAMATSDSIFATYSGPELLAEEINDVKKSLDRLLAARNAVAEELGLATPPHVVVTAQAKNVEATARHLQRPIESCLLFDDNAELAAHPRVVLVEALESLPRDRRLDLLAFMEAELPVSSLPSDLVEYLEDARPNERSLARTADGSLSWAVPEMLPGTPQSCWRTPAPEAGPVRSLSHQRLPNGVHILKRSLLQNGEGSEPFVSAAKSQEYAPPAAAAEPMSNVSPADTKPQITTGYAPPQPVRAASRSGLALIDLRAAAEKAAALRQKQGAVVGEGLFQPEFSLLSRFMSDRPDWHREPPEREELFDPEYLDCS